MVIYSSTSASLAASAGSCCAPFCYHRVALLISGANFKGTHANARVFGHQLDGLIQISGVKQQEVHQTAQRVRMDVEDGSRAVGSADYRAGSLEHSQNVPVIVGSAETLRGQARCAFRLTWAARRPGRAWSAGIHRRRRRPRFERFRQLMLR